MCANRFSLAIPQPKVLEDGPLRLLIEADDVRTRVPQNMGINTLDAPLKHLADAKVVQEYPQMWDIEGAHIAQYEHTVICKQAKEVLSQCNEWGVAPTIRYLLESLNFGQFHYFTEGSGAATLPFRCLTLHCANPGAHM
jgi:hypothetical protein